MNDIVQQRAKAVLKNAACVVDKKGNKSYLLFRNDNNYRISKLFLEDSGIAREIPADDSIAVALDDARIQGLEVIDKDRLFRLMTGKSAPEVLASANTDNEEVTHAIEGRISLDKGVALVIVEDDLRANAPRVFANLRDIIDTLVGFARRTGLNERQFRL